MSPQTAVISWPSAPGRDEQAGASSEDCVSVFEALKKKDVAAARAFIDEGIDVNASDEDGRALLHLAIMSGQDE